MQRDAQPAHHVVIDEERRKRIAADGADVLDGDLPVLEGVADEGFVAAFERHFADQAGAPADAGAQHEAVAAGQRFEQARELDVERRADGVHRAIEQISQVAAAQREQPELRDRLLLPRAHAQLRLDAFALAPHFRLAQFAFDGGDEAHRLIAIDAVVGAGVDRLEHARFVAGFGGVADQDERDVDAADAEQIERAEREIAGQAVVGDDQVPGAFVEDGGELFEACDGAADRGVAALLQFGRAAARDHPASDRGRPRGGAGSSRGFRPGAASCSPSGDDECHERRHGFSSIPSYHSFRSS